MDTTTTSSTSTLHKIFIGPNGLRAGWSVLIFIAIAATTIFLTALLLSLAFVHQKQPDSHVMTPLSAMLNELMLLAGWFVSALIMSLIERKPLLSYNYQGQYRAKRFFFGLLWGFIAASALILSLWQLGYLAFDGPPIFNLSTLKYGALWGFVFLSVGFAEESLLRGYLQSTLTRGIGFWWAAVLLSAGFGCIHVTNPGESSIGLYSAALIGLVFCLSLWYTGSLWWAIGFHAAWDWSESFFYGTADSGLVSHGRLLAARPVGNLYWSGGATGPEGSILVLVTILLLAIGMFFWWSKRTASPFAGSGWRPMRIVTTETYTAADVPNPS